MITSNEILENLFKSDWKAERKKQELEITFTYNNTYYRVIRKLGDYLSPDSFEIIFEINDDEYKINIYRNHKYFNRLFKLAKLADVKAELDLTISVKEELEQEYHKLAKAFYNNN